MSSSLADFSQLWGHGIWLQMDRKKVRESRASISGCGVRRIRASLSRNLSFSFAEHFGLPDFWRPLSAPASSLKAETAATATMRFKTWEWLQISESKGLHRTGAAGGRETTAPMRSSGFKAVRILRLRMIIAAERVTVMLQAADNCAPKLPCRGGPPLPKLPS